MNYLALARKYRPQMFSEVIGQAHVVAALTNALNNQRVHHAFLFAGTRGVGKTTLARIFAKALNCEAGVSAEPCGQCVVCRGVEQGNFIDLIEVDAASRTKVDDTRQLLDNVQYTPTQGRYKVYLIDEVHMLSMHSFNALLKTLEEPPEHVKFLLATTNPQKLPTTILSRCIQFNLKSVDVVLLSNQLEQILKAEKITYQSSALMILAHSANGSVRDALSLLDQAIVFGDGNIDAEQVRSMLGMIDDRFMFQLLKQIIQDAQTNQKGIAVLETVSQMAERSVDYEAALDELLTLIHNVALYQVSPQSVEWKGIDSANLADIATNVSAETLQLLYQIGIMGKRDFDITPNPRSGFEMVLIRMLAFQPRVPKGTASTQPKPQIASSPTTTQVKESKEQPTIPSTTDTAQAESDVSQQPTDKPMAIDAQQLMTVDGWQRFVHGSGLGGLSKQILMNMVPQSVVGKVVNLMLDSTSKHLFNDARLKKIQQHCSDNLLMDIQLKVEIRDLNDTHGIETPSQQHVREEKQKQSNTQQAFTDDPYVQELIDVFDAKIVPDSIKSD